MTTMDRVRQWRGPAVLSYGFRPFFLMAGIWAVLAMGLWIAVLQGWARLPSRLAPVDWHAHELLYGYLPAVLAGFLLTAVPNWTGRLPVVGWPLLAFTLWEGLICAFLRMRRGVIPAAIAHGLAIFLLSCGLI